MLHGKLTYYQVNNKVTNEVWRNNQRVSRAYVETPDEAWFGDGQPVVWKGKTADQLVQHWMRGGYSAKGMKEAMKAAH